MIDPSRLLISTLAGDYAAPAGIHIGRAVDGGRTVLVLVGAEKTFTALPDNGWAGWIHDGELEQALILESDLHIRVDFEASYNSKRNYVNYGALVWNSNGFSLKLADKNAHFKPVIYGALPTSLKPVPSGAGVCFPKWSLVRVVEGVDLVVRTFDVGKPDNPVDA